MRIISRNKIFPNWEWKETKENFRGAVLGSPAGSIWRDASWIWVQSVQLGEARGAQMNEGGELRRKS